MLCVIKNMFRKIRDLKILNYIIEIFLFNVNIMNFCFLNVHSLCTLKDETERLSIFAFYGMFETIPVSVLFQTILYFKK